VKVATKQGIAFFIQLAATQGAGATEILPVLWSDNYFSLAPEKLREFTARIALAISPARRPRWKLAAEHRDHMPLRRLEASQSRVKSASRSPSPPRSAIRFSTAARGLALDGRPPTPVAWAREPVAEVVFL